MTLISRLGHRIPTGFSKTPKFLASISSKPQWGFRTYSLPAQEEEEEELEMIDQRRLPTDYDPSTFDPTEHRSPPTDRVFHLVDEIANLTLLENAQLSKILMQKLGFKEPPVVGVMKPGAAVGLAGVTKAGSASGAKEEHKMEKTAFELKLEAFDAASKIKIIKEVRTFTDLGLKEAKELVEKTPTVIKTGVSKDDAQQIIDKMKALGAKVVME